MEKEMQGLEEGLKTKIHLDSLKSTLKKYQTGKLQAMMVCMDSGLKDTLPSMTDWLSKWIDVQEKIGQNIELRTQG